MTQRDILDYLLDPDYKEGTGQRTTGPRRMPPPIRPAGTRASPHSGADLAQLVAIVQDPATDLTATCPAATTTPSCARS